MDLRDLPSVDRLVGMLTPELPRPILTDIASLSRIVTPVQVEIEPHPTPQNFPDLVAPVLATFRIETYVLPDQAALPPAELPEG